MEDTTHSNSVTRARPSLKRCGPESRQVQLVDNELRCPGRHGPLAVYPKMFVATLSARAGKRDEPSPIPASARSMTEPAAAGRARPYDTERQPNGGINAAAKAAECCATENPAKHDHHHGGAAATRIDSEVICDPLRHRPAETKPVRTGSRSGISPS